MIDPSYSKKIFFKKFKRASRHKEKKIKKRQQEITKKNFQNLWLMIMLMHSYKDGKIVNG